MKNPLPYIAAGLLGWFGATKCHQYTAEAEKQQVDAQVQELRAPPEPQERDASEPREEFSCDGRIYCSQMTSCEEATYFLEHCPGVKMDGGHDGVPCERQWCGNR